ncbi:hypothetical protein EMCRGX_G032023 [Ephydatia muelleri]
MKWMTQARKSPDITIAELLCVTNDDTMTLNDVLMNTKIDAWHISKNLPLVQWVQLGNKKRMFFDELGEDAEARKSPDITIAELLCVTNDDTMTLNDVLMNTKIDAWHISKNLPLVQWVQLGNKKRMFFDELGEDAEAAFQYVSNSAAAAAIVAAAAAAGVKTLSQWNNISVEKQKEIMSETMLSCLHSRIEEWFQSLIVSGFKVSDHAYLATHSGRPSKYLWLSPSLLSDRSEYAPMTDEIKESLRGFLNPYIIIHPNISQHYHKEGELFNDLRKAFEREPWDTHAKGDALEKLLVSALQLRQIHTEGALPFNKVIGALCGKKNHQFFSSHEHDMVTFRSTVATGVETFPCHDATILRKAGEKNEADEKANLTLKDDRKRNAIDAVQRHGIIHPICLMNRGCDVILVLDFKDQNKGITLVFFETKYFYHGSSLKRITPAQKAYHVFEGLLDRSEPLGKCKVSPVCFTLCLTSGKEVKYDLKYKKYKNGPTLNELIEQLGKKGISVSLHSVTTIEEWMHLITPPLFYALPAIEGKATKKRKRN